MQFFVHNNSLKCEFYIDDLLILGVSMSHLLDVREVFQRYREQDISLDGMNLTIGKDKVPFVLTLCNPTQQTKLYFNHI